MEDQQNNPTEPEHSGIEMTSPEQPPKQVGSFPESAEKPSTSSQRSSRPSTSSQRSLGPSTSSQRSLGPSTSSQRSLGPSTSSQRSLGPSTSSQRSTREQVGHQVASGQSIAQLPQPSRRGILDFHDSELTMAEYYFLWRLELKRFNESGDLMFDRDDMDTEIESRGNACDDETADDKSYSLADESTKNDSTSEPSSLEQGVPEPKRQDFPRSIQAFAHSSIRESNSGAIQRRTIPRDITSEQSSLGQRKREQKRRYNRPRKLGPEDYRLPPGGKLELCRCLLVAVFMSILSFGVFVLFLAMIYFSIPK